MAEARLDDVLLDKLREKRGIVDNDERQSVERGAKIMCPPTGHCDPPLL